MTIQQKKPPDVIRRNGVFQCVKVGRLYYCVAHDPETGKTWGFVRPDRRAGEYRVTDMPYGPAAIEYVANGRKRRTAIVYFNEHMRKVRRISEIENPKELKCSWCDGTGQDPRNACWACSKCS